MKKLITIIMAIAFVSCHNYETVKIDTVESMYTTYVSAEYPVLGLGTSTHKVSDKFFVVQYNGKVVDYFCNDNPGNYYKCPPPTTDQYVNQESNFKPDKYTVNSTLKVKCYVSGPKGDLILKLNEEELIYALKHIGDSIIIDTGGVDVSVVIN